MKRPSFDDFREIFLNCLSEHTSQDPGALPEKKWDELGGPELRRLVLEAVNGSIRVKYGAEFEVNHRLINLQGPVETAIIQTFHELSTIHLMERINSKIRARMN